MAQGRNATAGGRSSAYQIGPRLWPRKGGERKNRSGSEIKGL